MTTSTPTSHRPVAITGANSGVGFEATRLLAAQGVPVVLICRSDARGQSAVDAVRAEHPGAELSLELCDLGDLEQVRALAARVRRQASHWGALVNNAGLYRARLEQTADGLERTLAVNHLGHYLLTRLLEAELRSGGVRIVNVSSQGHTRAKLRRRPLDEILTGPADYDGVQAYCDSKLCNVLFARALQTRYGGRGLMACSLHPGTLVTTDIGRGNAFFGLLMRLVSPFTKSCSQGAATSVWAAVHEPASELAGAYLRDCGISESTAESRDSATAQQLWERSDEMVEALAPTDTGRELPAWP